MGRGAVWGRLELWAWCRTGAHTAEAQTLLFDRYILQEFLL